MIDQINPRARRDTFGSKINRDHSPLLAFGVPWASILLASLTPWLPIIAPAPIVPPLAYMLLLAWRLMRPGLLPLWAGLPLGAFDDLFSGQPFGSGILLFSLTMMGIELLDMRFPWRSFWQDWIIAIGLIAVYLVLATILSGARLDQMELVSLAPQFLLAIVAYPVVARIVSLLDRLRLLRVRRLG
jgi:rod shape-determining protein MreD